jgi:hypothetical protein
MKNNSVLLCLRDGRHLRFKDSLLGSIESSLYEGPVYFNCHSNLNNIQKKADVCICMYFIKKKLIKK